MSASYRITLNEDQARLVCDALELLERCHLGQWGEVAREVSIGTSYLDGLLLAHDALDAIGRALYTRIRGHYGINSPEISERAREACDVMKALRYAVAWEAYPPTEPDNFRGVYHYEPRPVSAQPLPVVEVVK